METLTKRTWPDRHMASLTITLRCRRCGEPKRWSEHYAVSDCERWLGHPCEYPQEHHRYSRVPHVTIVVVL